MSTVPQPDPGNPLAAPGLSADSTTPSDADKHELASDRQLIRSWKRWLGLGIVVGAVVAPLGAWYYVTRPEYRYRRAIEAIERRDYPKAEELAWLLEGQGEPDRARLLRGRIRYEEAEALLKEAVEFARWDAVETSLRWLLHVGVVAAGPAPIHRQTWLHQPGTAEALLGFRPHGREQVRKDQAAASRYALALAELIQVHGDEPLHVEAANLRAQCLIRHERKLEAIHELEFVVGKQPDHRQAHSQLAGLFNDLGISHMVLKHAGEVARLDPADGMPYRYIAMIHHELREYELAIAAYEKALERKLPAAHRAEAIIELAMEYSAARPDKALQLLGRFPEEFSSKPEYHAIKAECLWADQKYREAVELIESTLKDHPDLQPALALRARMHLDTDEPGPAIGLLEKVVRINPSDHKARNHLAQAYRRLGDRLQAGRPVHGVLSAASGVGPGQVAASVAGLGDGIRAHYYARAQDHMERRDQIQGYMDALTRLHEEAMAKPVDDTVRLKIAQVWFKMERPDLGRVWLRATLDCNPRNAEALETLRRLNALEAP